MLQRTSQLDFEYYETCTPSSPIEPSLSCAHGNESWEAGGGSRQHRARKVKDLRI